MRSRRRWWLTMKSFVLEGKKSYQWIFHRQAGFSVYRSPSTFLYNFTKSIQNRVFDYLKNTNPHALVLSNLIVFPAVLWEVWFMVECRKFIKFHVILLLLTLHMLTGPGNLISKIPTHLILLVDQTIMSSSTSSRPRHHHVCVYVSVCVFMCVWRARACVNDQMT